MPVRRAQQPECNRRFEKGPLILRRGIAPAQQMKNRFDPRPSIALILARRNDRKSLAAVLLGQAQQAPILCPQPIEALHNQDTAVSIRRYLCFGSRQTDSSKQFQTQIFVFDAVGQVEAVGEPSD